MKRLIMLVISLIFALAGSSMAIDYKAEYEKKLEEIKATQKLIDSVMAWLKEHNYEKYEYAKIKVEDALDQVPLLEEAKKKAEAAAAKGDWKNAFLWANQVWQYQVKMADSALRAKQIVEDMERAGK